MTDILTLENVRDAVSGSAAAFRCKSKLQPVGGAGDKVFPPTYAGGVYASEKRRIGGDLLPCVLLDSVQSQANRMEEALLDGFLPDWREMKPGEKTNCGLPLAAVHVEGHGWVTSLTAPHRIHDAILRDSEIGEIGGTRFRDSEIGKQVVAARLHKATALYNYCPTALLFGTWDSTAGEGLDSAKVPRAVVSEIIGVDAVAGVRTASRIDPLGIRAGSATIYKLKDNEKDWALDESQAADAKKGNGKQKFGKGKPSDINHGNVTPDLPRFENARKQGLDKLPDLLRGDDTPIEDGAVRPGGVTMDHALHCWTLSLTQLRRLRFPGGNNGDIAARNERNEAARTVIAVLGLHALALQQERGYWLRSRCELVPEEMIEVELVGGTSDRFTLPTPEATKDILNNALQEANKHDLSWGEAVTKLTPTEKLQNLVEASDKRGPDADGEEEPADAGAAG